MSKEMVIEHDGKKYIADFELFKAEQEYREELERKTFPMVDLSEYYNTKHKQDGRKRKRSV